MSNQKIKIFVICDDEHYCNWIRDKEFTHKMKEADLVVGIGGSDVSNIYYNQPDSGKLHCYPEFDKYEYEHYLKAISLKKPIVGICKGAQWASALSGGAIFQNIIHPHHHFIETNDGQRFIVNSLHHNLIDLSQLKENEDYKMLAWANHLSPIHINGYNQNIKCEKEPEIVWFKKINFLGFQMHPEMMHYNSKFDSTMSYFKNLLNLFMVGNL